MRFIFSFFMGFVITLLGLNVLAQNVNVHDKSFDTKSISNMTFDNNSSAGTVTVQEPSSNTAAKTVTLPAINDTLIGRNIGQSGVNWADLRAFASSNGGDHSAINWQSFGV